MAYNPLQWQQQQGEQHVAQQQLSFAAVDNQDRHVDVQQSSQHQNWQPHQQHGGTIQQCSAVLMQQQQQQQQDLKATQSPASALLPPHLQFHAAAQQAMPPYLQQQQPQSTISQVLPPHLRPQPADERSAVSHMLPQSLQQDVPSQVQQHTAVQQVLPPHLQPQQQSQQPVVQPPQTPLPQGQQQQQQSPTGRHVLPPHLQISQQAAAVPAVQQAHAHGLQLLQPQQQGAVPSASSAIDLLAAARGAPPQQSSPAAAAAGPMTASVCRPPPGFALTDPTAAVVEQRRAAMAGPAGAPAAATTPGRPAVPPGWQIERVPPAAGTSAALHHAQQQQQQKVQPYRPPHLTGKLMKQQQRQQQHQPDDSTAAPLPAAAAAAAVSTDRWQPQQQQHTQQQQQGQAVTLRLPAYHYRQILAQESDIGSAQSSSSSSSQAFSLQEAMRWLHAYAPDTAALVDDSMMGYFSYIARKHSSSVLACVLFFAMAHPQEFKGATPKLLLQTADHPVKVLNNRLSFYRDLFGATVNGVPKAEALAALIVRRPDVAAGLSHNVVVRLFDAEVAVGPVLELLAGLALLPDCWHEVVDGQPQVWLSSFVSAVLQDASNANRMALHLEKKLLTVTALTEGGINRPTPFAADQQQVPQQQQQQQLVHSQAAAEAPAALAAGDAALLQCLAGQQSPGWQSRRHGSGASPLWEQLQQQSAVASTAVMLQQAAPAAPARAAAAKLSAARHNHSSNSALQQPAAAAGAALAAATADDDDESSSSSGSSNKNEVIKLAFMQLMRDRPDVIGFVINSLREEVYGMTLEAALAAVGALAEVPKNWRQGVKNPTAELVRVVARAAALSAAAAPTSASSAAADGRAADAGTADDGWIEHSKSYRSASKSGRGAAAAAMGEDDDQGFASRKSLSAAWAAVQNRRPDVWESISREDKEIIRTELSEEQQLQMLSMLLELPESSLKAAANPRQLMTRVIQKHKRLITQQINPALQAALEQLQQCLPEVMAHIDPSMLSHLSSLPLHKSLLVVRALQETEYEEGWAQKVKFPTRWLMGIMGRVLRDNKE